MSEPRTLYELSARISAGALLVEGNSKKRTVLRKLRRSGPKYEMSRTVAGYNPHLRCQPKRLKPLHPDLFRPKQKRRHTDLVAAWYLPIDLCLFHQFIDCFGSTVDLPQGFQHCSRVYGYRSILRLIENEVSDERLDVPVED